MQLIFSLEWFDQLKDEQSDDCLRKENAKLGDKQVSADHHGAGEDDSPQYEEGRLEEYTFARLQSQVAVKRAVLTLNLPILQVLEVLHSLPDKHAGGCN